MNYIKIYNQIISRAKDQVDDRLYKKKNGSYFEGHHIIPKCLGGTGNSRQYFHKNIVLLTAREHFLCHWLLHEIYPDNTHLSLAFYSMCHSMKNCRYTPSSRIIEYSRLQMSNNMKGSGNPMYGKTHSEIARQKIGNAHKGKIISEDTKKLWVESGRGKSWIGKTHSEESKNKMRKVRSEESKLKMRKSAINRPIKKCPHCEYASTTNMERWHFDNCRKKETQE
jgi:hypothetical protein